MSTRRGWPVLHLALPLEGQVRGWVEAATAEDEEALRAWLRYSPVLEALPEAVERLLDVGPDVEERAA